MRILGFQVRQSCTTRIDGLGPDGNRMMDYPQNAVTCDSDGDGGLDGNRLFSRPPLVVHLEALQGGEREADAPLDLWLILNHWKSKVEDTRTDEYTLPRRLEQARFVAALAEEVLASQPGVNLVIAGDLNDYPASEPLSTLTSLGFRDLTLDVKKARRYTYVFQGVSQVLDYVLARTQPGLISIGVEPVHINADYPHVFTGMADNANRSSDHDPLLVVWMAVHRFTYLPVVFR